MDDITHDDLTPPTKIMLGGDDNERHVTDAFGAPWCDPFDEQEMYDVPRNPQENVTCDICIEAFEEEAENVD